MATADMREESRGRKRRQRNRKGEFWRAAPTLQCQGCGSDFKPKRTDRMKFCSRECAFSTKAFQSACRNARSHKVSFITCKVCKKLFCSRGGVQAYCGDECRKVSAYSAVPKVTLQCADCGTEIKGTAAKTTCKRCLRKKHGRKHIHRARKYRVHYETVNPIKVFMRDGWRCQSCRVRTPQELRGKNQPQSPELDHIVPLSRGGEHSYRNTQLLCRACNMAKSNKVIGQTLLFG